MADQNPTAPLPPSQYINTMRVRHSQREFYFDFGQLAGVGDGTTGIAHLITTIVTTPAHAKEMLQVLARNVQLYEAQFGQIQEAVITPPVKQ
jgi:hypothetical protein